MEKRTVRNKKLYDEVNRKIKEKALHSSNDDFKNTSNTLKNINPQLFGNDDDSITTKPNKNAFKIKKYLPIIVLLIVIILVVVIAILI